MEKETSSETFTKEELANIKQATEQSKVALALYREGISLCQGILEYVAKNVDLKKDVDRKIAKLIFIRLTGTMQSIKCLSLKGYYYEASVLIEASLKRLEPVVILRLTKERGISGSKTGKLVFLPLSCLSNLGCF